MTANTGNEWKISIKNPLNDYEQRSGITINVNDLVEVENDHVGAMHYAMRWEGEKKFSTLRILDGSEKALAGKKKLPSNAPKAITESGVWTNVLAVETRGVEPVDWIKGVDEFTVVSTGGTVYTEEIDFSDEWCEYCEKSEESVGISNIEYRWSTV